MIRLAITQRVDIHPVYHERRDALDQRWQLLADAANVELLRLPNNAAAALSLLKAIPVQGLIFSGGNTLTSLGGDAPERDETELALLTLAVKQHMPVLGVCRGMQFIQHYFGQTLIPVTGHVSQQITISAGSEIRQVNSYHQWGSYNCPAPLIVTAKAADGVVKACRHDTLPLFGIMWHPERMSAFDPLDLQLIKGFSQK